MPDLGRTLIFLGLLLVIVPATSTGADADGPSLFRWRRVS